MRYWAQEGFSSIKTHGDVSKDALAAIIEEAHAVRLPGDGASRAGRELP